MIILKNILVATDFGEPAEAALAYGRELARQFTGKLHVVHIIPDITMGLSGLPYAGENYLDIGRWEREVLRGAEAQLNALLSDEDRRELHATPVAIIATNPAVAILEYAKDQKVDLIIAGTHGRGALGHLVMGSVAERLVRAAGCPVLVVRHPEREFVLPDALEVVARKA